MTDRMLDTNFVSGLIKNDAAIKSRLKRLPPTAVHISAVTRAELQYGLARRPEATNLAQIVRQFLQTVTTCDWDSASADTYGRMRASLERQGVALSPFDLMIAAHAQERAMPLVTHDRAFTRIKGLTVETWT